jgi:hypothetical protein
VEEEFGRWRWSWVRPRSSAIEEWRRRSSPRERMNRGKGEDNVGPEDTRRCAEEEDGTEVIPRVIYRVSLVSLESSHILPSIVSCDSIRR